VPRAFKRPRRPLVVVVVRTPTPNYLRQASPDRGKYQKVWHRRRRCRRGFSEFPRTRKNATPWTTRMTMSHVHVHVHAPWPCPWPCPPMAMSMAMSMAMYVSCELRLVTCVQLYSVTVVRCAVCGRWGRWLVKWCGVWRLGPVFGARVPGTPPSVMNQH